MNSVTVRRSYEADPATVRSVMNDTEPFMQAGGFDEATVSGSVVELTNQVGIATLSLTLDLVEDSDATLAYEQREGIFETMRTTYAVEPRGDGCEVVATTTFAIDVALVGPLMDATVIKRQRRKELDAQFDWIADQVGGAANDGVEP